MNETIGIVILFLFLGLFVVFILIEARSLQVLLKLKREADDSMDYVNKVAERMDWDELDARELKLE